MRKLDITGASNFVNRMFEAAGPYQWVRELLKNAEEANAGRVEFGVEWQAVEKLGIYRRTVADDGVGMDRDEIIRFFSTLGAGAKQIGGVHDNFGVGAKIATLPWNPEGLVVMSWKNGQGSMIWIQLDPDSGDYFLVEFEHETGLTCVIDPDSVDWLTAEDEQLIDWSKVKPDWIEEHGTVIVLMGSEEHPDTFLGNPDADESALKGIMKYLNTRFWDLSHLEVHVHEFTSEQKNKWPTAADGEGTQRRQAQGATYFLSEVQGQGEGALKASDVLWLDDARVDLEWYLWEGERPRGIGPYAQRGGYIAIRYKNELFHVTTRKIEFRWFGIIEPEVKHRTTIILEPRPLGEGPGRWGVHPDQSRTRLIFTGRGLKGAEIPLFDWAQEFAEVMPEPIKDAILAARAGKSGTIQDEEYRKRLQDKFGDRWRASQLVAAKNKRGTARPSDDEVEVFNDGEGPGKGGTKGRKGGKRGSIRVSRRRAFSNGDRNGQMQPAPVDVPRYGTQTADAFDPPQWHLATWAPRDPEGPTVYINIESPILREVIEYHQEQYPEVFHHEVEKIVIEVFGEVAACKVAHSQRLTKELPEQEVDERYRSDAALTVALMGLISEESLIAQRVGRLGRKKVSAE